MKNSNLLDGLGQLRVVQNVLRDLVGHPPLERGSRRLALGLGLVRDKLLLLLLPAAAIILAASLAGLTALRRGRLAVA